jgi:hypothetical protein
LIADLPGKSTVQREEAARDDAGVSRQAVNGFILFVKREISSIRTSRPTTSVYLCSR